MRRLRLVFDNFTLVLIAAIAIASIFPVQGKGAQVAGWVTNIAIALLFFLHGAKLSRDAIIAGAMHWRLHLLVFSLTFILFPALGWLLQPVLTPLLGPSLYIGVLYLCVLPGTVQSAIAFTAIARGNVAAAVCSASASSLIGIVLTPLLLKLLLTTNGETPDSTMDAIIHIGLQLLLPFMIGHLMRPWIGNWVDRNRSWLGYIDQSSIVLVVYTAFSASVIDGLWHVVPPKAIIGLSAVCVMLLFLVLCMTTWAARRLKFSKDDEITIVFCGSKKSMATGVPMAQLLFTGTAVGPALLPLMIFHQMQLMICAVLARRYGGRSL